MCHVDNVLVPEARPREALNTQPLIHSPRSHTPFTQEPRSVHLARQDSTKTGRVYAELADILVEMDKRGGGGGRRLALRPRNTSCHMLFSTFQ